MDECNSTGCSFINRIRCNEASNLDKEHFRLNKINEIKDYFLAENKERLNV